MVNWKCAFPTNLNKLFTIIYNKRSDTLSNVEISKDQLLLIFTLTCAREFLMRPNQAQTPKFSHVTYLKNVTWYCTEDRELKQNQKRINHVDWYGFQIMFIFKVFRDDKRLHTVWGSFGTQSPVTCKTVNCCIISSRSTLTIQ